MRFQLDSVPCERYKMQAGRKPGSVVDDHLSRPYITVRFLPPLRPSGQRSVSYTVLLRMGFTRPPNYPGAGELLPRLFILTRLCGMRLFSVALSLELPPPGVTRHPALWSPDFPQTRPFGAAPAIIKPACSGYYNKKPRSSQARF